MNQPAGLRVRLGLPECGGLEVTIHSPTQEYRNNFDFIYPSLPDLVTALAVLLDADG